MENQMTIFKNPAFGEVRTMTMENGQVGFVGKDIATHIFLNDLEDWHYYLKTQMDSLRN